MPEKRTLKKSKKAKKQGKAASTQAGPFVEEEMHHMRSGKHKVKNKKQAIAIGLSKARQSGVKVPKKGKSKSSSKTSHTRKHRTHHESHASA